MHLFRKLLATSCSAHCNVEAPKMHRCQCRCRKNKKIFASGPTYAVQSDQVANAAGHFAYIMLSWLTSSTQLLRPEVQTEVTRHTSVNSKVAPYRRLLEKPVGKTVYKSSPSALTSSFLAPLLALLTRCSPNTALA